MNTIKIIRTRKDHLAALAEMKRLMIANPAPGSPDAEKIELLALVVESYEKKHFPLPKPDPVDAILFRMEQQGLERSDLVPLLGSRSKVSEVLARKRTLSIAMIRALHQRLGIPAEVLLREYSIAPA